MKEVRKVRHEEVGLMTTKGVWAVRPIKECRDKTGKDPVSVRWVDTN